MIWVGIIGAKGHFGEVLSKLVAGHPSAQVSTMMNLPEFCEADACMYSNKKTGYRSIIDAVKKSDIIFSGLSGSLTGDIYSEAASCGKRIIDISEAHYLADGLAGSASAYPGSVYGLAELYKDKIRGASVAANPSGYCTGALLGLAPLAAGDLVDMDSAVIESKSGITSLRRNDKLTETGMTDNYGIKIYKVECTAYAQEVKEQILALFGKGISASYASYIVPGIKGITTTIKVNPRSGMRGDDVFATYKDFFKSNPFVEVKRSMAGEDEKAIRKCFCKIETSVDADSDSITVTTVLNDAVMGVAGQAIQTMNLMCGIDGKIGL